MRVKLASAIAEVDRLAEPAGPTGSIAAMQSLQDDYDRYLALLGPDNAIVKGLHAQLDTAKELQSPTAVAVEQAKTLLDLLLKYEPDDREAIQEARAALDAAKIANGSKESDCY